ncbi:MAG TPA: hypothetical protein VN253_00755 [Kofleriaceae bacterium]|nr:hypothetical protein [Kofleriaceae bacterium]
MRLLFASLSILTLGASACSNNEPPPPPPPPPIPQIVLDMSATIAAGADLEYCRFVTVPETWVTKDTIEFTPGSHHVLVYQTSYTSIPTQKDDGTKVDTSGVFDCSGAAFSGWSLTKLVGGSQNPHGEAMLSFPEGIGMKLGGVLLINAHYRNGSDGALATDIKIKFDTTTADAITQEGDLLFLDNPLIAVPPHGTARAQRKCPVYRDITIANIQSHMHGHGVSFEARVAGGAPFYVNDRWEDVPVQTYEGFRVPAGSQLDYVCNYHNTTGTAIYRGARGTDEMCTLIGSYYPADPRTSGCLDETGTRPGGDWIGQGTATCAKTMGCMQAATTLQHVTDCILAAAPNVSRASSDLLRCFYASQTPQTECGAQIQACAAQ